MAYSCYHDNTRAGENFTGQHTLPFVIAGSIDLDDGKKLYHGPKNSMRLVQRNTLIKFEKKTNIDEPFKSLSIYFDLETLNRFAIEYKLRAKHLKIQKPVIDIELTPSLKNYFDSILDYIENGYFETSSIVDLKLMGGLWILINTNPDLIDFLFNFNEPYKIDLKNFMNENFHFNVHIDRFAYLTGRSLATFKRDFMKEFSMSPSRWLTDKRLEQAYKLIFEEKKTPSEFFYKLGFEDLSHFSFAFKKKYGIPPSKLKIKN